jgi:cob(I)alamin adenosyltransferase
MPVYTRRGDEGQTDLFSGERVSKTNPRIEGYGCVDELNTLLGVALSHLENHEDVAQDLETAQNKLHVICANLANTDPDSDRPEIDDEDVEKLEERIDDLNEELPPLKAFILPGGSQPGSFLHHARSVCRRSERRVIEIGQKAEIRPGVVKYLNRLSDYLFVASRAVNHQLDETEMNPSYE